MVAQSIGVGHAMVMLKPLVVLGLRRVLMLRVLEVVQQVGHASPGAIDPGMLTLPGVLGKHPGRGMSV